jgi:hypothetical protein
MPTRGESRATSHAEAAATRVREERLAHEAVARERHASLALPETDERRPRRKARASEKLDATPARRRVLWDEQSDRSLARAVAAVRYSGASMWRAVAESLFVVTSVERSAKQCRERFQNHVDSRIDKAPFSDDELAFIDAKLALCGPRWSLIATEFRSRTAMQIKNWATRRHGRVAIERFRNAAAQREAREARHAVTFAVACGAEIAEAEAEIPGVAELLANDGLELDLAACDGMLTPPPRSRAASPASEEDFGLAELQTLLADEEPKTTDTTSTLRCTEELPRGVLWFPQCKRLTTVKFGEGRAAFKRSSSQIKLAFAKPPKKPRAAFTATFA